MGPRLMSRGGVPRATAIAGWYDVLQWGRGCSAAEATIKVTKAIVTD